MSFVYEMAATQRRPMSNDSCFGGGELSRPVDFYRMRHAGGLAAIWAASHLPQEPPRRPGVHPCTIQCVLIRGAVSERPRSWCSEMECRAISERCDERGEMREERGEREEIRETRDERGEEMIEGRGEPVC